MFENIITTVIGVVLTAIIGSLQYRMKKIESELDKKISKADVREFVKDKLEAYTVKMAEVKEDLDRIETKLDRLIEK